MPAHLAPAHRLRGLHFRKLVCAPMTKPERDVWFAKPCVTAGDIARAESMGLRVVSYQDRHANGVPIPADLIGRDGLSLIIWRGFGDNGFLVPGWHPWHDGRQGTCFPMLRNALDWLERAMVRGPGGSRQPGDLTCLGAGASRQQPRAAEKFAGE